MGVRQQVFAQKDIFWRSNWCGLKKVYRGMPPEPQLSTSFARR